MIISRPPGQPLKGYPDKVGFFVLIIQKALCADYAHLHEDVICRRRQHMVRDVFCTFFTDCMKNRNGGLLCRLQHLKRNLSGCSYPGRGIVIGRSADGTKAVTAYFIMGRSANSRNRVFVEDKGRNKNRGVGPSKLKIQAL